MSTFAEFGKESRSIKPPIPEEGGAFAEFAIPERSLGERVRGISRRIAEWFSPSTRTLSVPREEVLGGQLVPVELAPSHKVGAFASPGAFQRPETTIEEGAGVEQGPSPQIPLEATPQAPPGPPKGPLGRARDVLGRELTVPAYEPVRYPSEPPVTTTPGREEFLSAREEPERPAGAELQPLATLGEALKKPKELSEKDRARASNILALSQETNLPPNVIEKNYDVITKQLGIRGTPTSGELVSKIMEWAIGAGLAARPISTVVGILSYMGWKEAESLAVQKIKGEEAKLGAGREMKEFLPPLKEPFQSAVEAAEFLIPASLAGGTIKAVRSFRQGWQEGRAWAARQAEEATRAKAGRKALPPSPEEIIEAEIVELRKGLPAPAKQLPPAPPEAEGGAFADFGKPPENRLKASSLLR